MSRRKASAAKRYRTIVADPPWDYQDGNASWVARNAGRFLPYQSMSVDEIKAMPVKELSQNDVAGNRRDRSVPRDGSVLYLWTTTRYLPVAHDVAKDWGFTPSAVLVWCKKSRGWNVGGTFPSNVEFVVYGRRGSPPPSGRTSSRWFEWPRSDHSTKPEAFYDLVETVSPGPYLEIFARRQRLGWDTWGNEALNHVEMSA